VLTCNQLCCSSYYYKQPQAVILFLIYNAANAEGPCEHAVGWNLVKCCRNGQGIASQKPCNWWMTFKVTGICAIWQVTYDFLSVFRCKHVSYLVPFDKILKGHVTVTTLLSGRVSPPKANTWHSLQNLTTLASAVPKIFQRMQNSKMGHVALTTWGTDAYHNANTSCKQPMRKIGSLSLALAIPKIFYWV